MKFGSFTPKPGDLFQWYYDFDDEKLPDSYNIWLGDQRIFVSSSGINMLVSLTITDIWWINNCHFIHARVDEISAARWGAARANFIHARVDDLWERRARTRGTTLHPQRNEL